MMAPLDRELFFVKEHVGMFKAANNFDIFDGTTGEEIMHCREPHLGGFTKLLRFTDYKRNTPFDIRVTTTQGLPVIGVSRGVSFFLSKVTVTDEQGSQVGGFKQKLFSIGGKFDVLDHTWNPVMQLKGKWTSWEFSFLDNGREIAKVSKKWAGLGRELFTSADNYMLEIPQTDVPYGDPRRKLILAAVMCIDMVLKE